MSLPSKPSEDDAVSEGHRDAERTEACWQPGMSRATYVRLLRLLFDPSSDDDGGDDRPEGRAA